MQGGGGSGIGGFSDESSRNDNPNWGLPLFVDGNKRNESNSDWFAAIFTLTYKRV